MSAANYYDNHYDDDAYWPEEEPAWFAGDGYGLAAPRPGLVINPLMLVAAALIIFVGFSVLVEWVSAGDDDAAPAGVGGLLIPAGTPQVQPLPQSAADAFAAPYDEYWVTQGLHGAAYGHMAIDVAAGQGTPIKSPIAGAITARYTDGVGNPVLVIENAVYRVTLLHGIYTANVGDQVALGQVVGEESNIGYTTDMQGRLCSGRDCGYHTHLNVFDKRLNSNVNPLDLLNR